MDEACYIRGVSDATWIEKIARIDEEESIDELETGLDRARGTSFSSPELHFRSKSKPVSGPRIESGRTGDYNVSKVVSHVMVVYFHCGERIERSRLCRSRNYEIPWRGGKISANLRMNRFCVTLESIENSISLSV